ncbi:MAG: mechanosensitive ion channel family protein [Vicinamibacterales bacterium]
MEGARLPANWPELTLALTLALLAAYLVAGLAARLVSAILRGVVADPEHETLFIERPQRVIKVAIFVVTAAALALPALRLAGYRGVVAVEPEALGRWLLNAGLRIGVIWVAAYFVIRIGSAAARRFEREMSYGTGLDVIERTKRAQTLSRLLQKTLTIVVGAIAVLMVLRELDIDITPVLTGAGIAGLAIGFGAQTLVRDIISGFFLILEDQVRVGDVAVVNGQGGLVEELNLRTIVLRDYDGTVHVFPNGEVKTLANKSKDFSYYVIDIGMEYGDEPDRVIAAMRDAAASMTDDPLFKPNILEPLEVAGVDAFAESQVTIRARIKTVPLKQWEIGRELRRRIYLTLKERNISIPYAHITVHLDRPEPPQNP